MNKITNHMPTAGKDDAVVAAEGAHHDERRHDGRARSAEDHSGRSGTHPVSRCMLNLRHRQQCQVCVIRQEVEHRYQTCTEQQAQGNVALGPVHLARDEGDVVPCVTAEERSHKCHAESRKQRHPEKRRARLRAVACQGKTGGLPAHTEILRQHPRAGGDPQPEHDQAQQRDDLGQGEAGLQDLSVAHSACIEPSEQHDAGDGEDLRRAYRHETEVHQDIVRAQHREKDRRVFREGHGHRRDQAGLDHREDRPPVHEGGQFSESALDVDVLPARFGHHRGQFTVTQCGQNGHHTGHHPSGEHPGRGTELPHHVGADDEDAAADHGTGNEHHGIQQGERAFESGHGGGVGV